MLVVFEEVLATQKILDHLNHLMGKFVRDIKNIIVVELEKEREKQDRKLEDDRKKVEEERKRWREEHDRNFDEGRKKFEEEKKRWR